MAWNIQFFTETRVNNPNGATQTERLNNMLTASANRQYITSTVARVDPSVFIVIEPLSDAGDVGTLAGGGGPLGLRYLLNAFRQYDNNWCLVPPLKTRNREEDGRTYTETVGVFYRSDRLQFVGPYVWPQAAQATGPSVPPGATAATYPAPWDGAVPPGTTAAAQCQFRALNGTEITFPNPENRRPVLTTFREVAAPNRTLKIFSCHTKPGTDARTATARMMGLAEAVPGANEVSVLIGDFNLDFRSANTVTGATILYLQGIVGFTPVINAPPTMYTRVAYATPLAYLRNLCVDNAWIRYGIGAAPGGGLPLGYVVNRVIDGTGPAPGVPWDMLDGLGEILALPVGQQNTTFRENVNFGHLGPPAAGTSDHLPIVADL
jgi:hypothetical protein